MLRSEEAKAETQTALHRHHVGEEPHEPDRSERDRDLHPGLYGAGRAGSGRAPRGCRGYFLGERNIPAWAVMISIVATETSTATFLSVPGVAYEGDLTYLQLPMGYSIGRVIVATVLLPSYFRGQHRDGLPGAGNRFGDATRRTASLLFLVTGRSPTGCGSSSPPRCSSSSPAGRSGRRSSRSRRQRSSTPTWAG